MNENTRVRTLTIGMGLLLLAVTFVYSGWIAEDAFITFRSVEQVYAGRGPQWNPHERVQSFTHPLWFLALTSLRLLTENLYFSALILGLLCSLVCCSLLLKKCRTPCVLIGAATVLISSKSFVDYSTSGLENPLAHLCIIFALRQYFLGRSREAFGWTALLGVTRADAILTVLPLCLYFLLRTLSSLGIRRTLSELFPGASLLLAWHLFAIWFFGFFFPNTAYAKLGAGLSVTARLSNGLHYVVNSISWDPVTVCAILLALLCAAFARSTTVRLTGLGIFFQCLYVLWIGGDFMSGRFFSLPFVASIFLILETTPLILVSGPLVAALYLVCSPRHLWPEKELLLKDKGGVADERLVYFQSTGLLPCLRRLANGDGCIAHRLAQQGQKYRESDTLVKVWPNVGMFGYFSGTEKIIIDELALTDPLLARLPTRKKNPRIGHYPRAIPKGYEESLLENKNLFQDASIAQCYRRLSLATKGDLTSLERLKNLISLQALRCANDERKL